MRGSLPCWSLLAFPRWPAFIRAPDLLRVYRCWFQGPEIQMDTHPGLSHPGLCHRHEAVTTSHRPLGPVHLPQLSKPWSLVSKLKVTPAPLVLQCCSEGYTT